jgi:hypothetical protein
MALLFLLLVLASTLWKENVYSFTLPKVIVPHCPIKSTASEYLENIFLSFNADCDLFLARDDCKGHPKEYIFASLTKGIGLSPEEAEDIVQELYTSVAHMSYVESYPEDEAVRYWQDLCFGYDVPCRIACGMIDK